MGSAALIGSVERPPKSLVNTIDIDIFPLRGQAANFDMEAVDQQIGEQSQFRVKHGFYVERVGDWTVMDQPAGWKERATRIELSAGREKDISFVTKMLQERIVTPGDLEKFIRAGSPDFRLQENLQRFGCIIRQIR